MRDKRGLKCNQFYRSSDSIVRLYSSRLYELKAQSATWLRTENPKSQRVFVLADTHNRLPDSVKEMAKDADEIWHLGDVCAEAILDELRAIGPRVTSCAEIATAISSGRWFSTLREVG